MSSKRELFEAIRRKRSERENHIIDEYLAGKIDRRTFVRHSSIVGLSLPVAGFLAACGDDNGTPQTAATTTQPATTQPTTDTAATTTQPTTDTAATTTAAPAEPEAGPVTVRVGMRTLATAVDPVLINDIGGVQFLSQVAETLTWSANDGTLRPLLAESWSPNDDSTVWTFKLRPGVRFSDGTPMTAADVVATFEGIAAGNAASALATGRLSPGNTVAIDDLTVEFRLDGPVGAFPYLVSTDNYNAVITPASFWANYTEGLYQESFIGTGPYLVESYEPEASAVFVRNPNYRHADSVTVDRVEVTFFTDDAPTIAAMLDGRLDIVPFFSPGTGAALFDNPEFVVTTTPSTTHRQIHFNTALSPFDDKRVRQAVAYAIDRVGIVEGVFDGYAVLGNDHPIAASYAMHAPGVPEQRHQDLQLANQLMDAAGARGAGADVNTYTDDINEPLAQVLQSNARDIGLDFNVQIHDPGTYFSDYWLTGTPVGVTGYGHRGIPNVFLTAPLRSDGPWNASGPWVNAEYDALLDRFVGESDLEAQRSLAAQIQTLLNEEVPVLWTAFREELSARRASLSGEDGTIMGHIAVQNAFFG